MQYRKADPKFTNAVFLTLTLSAGTVAFAQLAPSPYSVYFAGVIPTAAILLMLYRNRETHAKTEELVRQNTDARKQLLALFEHAPEALFVVDQQGIIRSANRCACESVGMKKAELLSKPLADLAPEALKGEVPEQLERWFSGEVQHYEGALKALDGKVCPVEITGRLRQRGESKDLLLQVRDLTLRKEAENKIHASRQMAEEAREMAEQARRLAEASSLAKSEFLANMSRGIRTPLNDIIGMAQLLTDQQQTGDSELAIIRQSSEGLLKVIDHVLDIAKIESGQMDFLMQDFDIREVCKSLQQQFQHQADRAGTDLTCRCRTDVPLYLTGDERLIRQALAILLDNALRFTLQGTVTLNIECLSKSASSAALQFQVVDTGIGIPEDVQATLFDRAAKRAKTGTPPPGDSGLGLAVCKRQIELMGGVMGLTSTEQEGSTFFFNLSLPRANNPKSIQALDDGRGETVLREGTRVLLVEDNQVNQKVGAAMLKRIGCRVDTADNGRDAVLQISRGHYDLLFMDCEMPVMDGFEATRSIRALREPHCRIPIIAITANAMKDDRKNCLAAGMNDYISKPVNRRMLVKLINKYTADSYTT